MQRVTVLYHFCVKIRMSNDIFACSIPVFPKHDGYTPMKFKVSSDILNFSTQKLENTWINAAMAVAIDYDPSPFLRVEFQLV